MVVDVGPLIIKPKLRQLAALSRRPPKVWSSAGSGNLRLGYKANFKRIEWTLTPYILAQQRSIARSLLFWSHRYTKDSESLRIRGYICTLCVRWRCLQGYVHAGIIGRRLRSLAPEAGAWRCGSLQHTADKGRQQFAIRRGGVSQNSIIFNSRLSICRIGNWQR
jgi:hypothetical protein